MLRGGRLLAQVNFTAVSTQTTVVPLLLSNLTAIQASGVAVPRTLADPSRVVVVGNEPLVEVLMSTNQQPMLVLYGEPGPNYLIQSTTDLQNTNLWQTAWQGTLTNLIQVIGPATSSQGTYFRALRQ